MSNEIVCNSAEFGENFLKARKRLNLSLADVAERLNSIGVKSDTGAMSKVERDLQEPGVIWAANAALQLNTTLDRLVYRETPEVQSVRRELKPLERNFLAELVETLCALDDECPSINWFEVASVSAKSTRDSVLEQLKIPAGTVIKKTADGEKVYDAPTPTKALKPPSVRGPVIVGEEASPYGVDQ